MVKSLERSTPDSNRVRKKVPIFKYALSIGLYKGLHSVEDLEKAMAPHSSTLACRILWMEEPGRLQSMGSRVRHD